MSGVRTGWTQKPPIAFLRCVLPIPLPESLWPARYENLPDPRLTPSRAPPPSSSGYLRALA